MEPDDVHAHWQDWAVRYGTELRATTLASSIKRLEVDTLRRAIKRALPIGSPAQILEVGCGNGQNIVALARAFADHGYDWTGIDYVPEMVERLRRTRLKLGSVPASASWSVMFCTLTRLPV